MSENGHIALPAAWYPDPQNAAVLRWWDGASWTEHVKELPPPPTATVSASVPVVPPAPLVRDQPEITLTSAQPIVIGNGIGTTLTPQQVAHQRATGGGFVVSKGPDPEAEGFVIKTSVPEINARYSADGARYVPLSMRNDLPAESRDDNDNFDKDDDVGSKHTVEMWLIAALPAFAFAAQFSLLHFTEIFNKNPHLFWVVPVLYVGLGFVFAQLDRGTLLSRNLKNPPHGATGLVPPIYFIMRAARITPASLLPLVLWAALVIGLAMPALILYQGVPGGVEGYLQLLEKARIGY